MTGSIFSYVAPEQRRDLYEDYDDIVRNYLTIYNFEPLCPLIIENVFLFLQRITLSEGTNASFKGGVGPTNRITRFLRKMGESVTEFSMNMTKMIIIQVSK
uniref:Uncharacterized protein n=1 Tax=Leersia perrieri TaxID=77586 RepID=A0A0D9V166_9ORYZ